MSDGGETCQRLGLIRARRNHYQRPFEPEDSLAQHQSSGRTLEAHHRETTVAPRSDARLKLAGRFFKAPEHDFDSSNALRPSHRTKQHVMGSRRWNISKE